MFRSVLVAAAAAHADAIVTEAKDSRGSRLPPTIYAGQKIMRAESSSPPAEQSQSHRIDPNQPNVACNDAYPSGVSNAPSKCMEPHHNLISDAAMCAEAAKHIGHTIEDFGDKTNPGWGFPMSDDLDLRWKQATVPAGCFEAPCKKSENAGKTCMVYNPVAEDTCVADNRAAGAGKGELCGDNKDQPCAISRGPDVYYCYGTAVCYTAKYLEGKENTNGLGADCPEHYKVITCDPNTDNTECDAAQEACKKAASCVGNPVDEGRDDYLLGEGNKSQKMDFPQGCFIHPVNHMFYMNRPSPLGLPTGPKGTPMCVTKKDYGEWAADGNGNATHAGRREGDGDDAPATPAAGS